MTTTNSIIFEGIEYTYNTFTAQDITDYKGLRDMYHGEGGFKDGSYLERFPRESYGQIVNDVQMPDFFGQRKKLAHYENLFRKELNAKVNPIFAKDQVRKTEGSNVSVVEQFIDNPTKRFNESMSDYQRRKAINTELYGAIFEICDGPNDTPENGGGDLDPNSMEYSYFLTPLNTYAYGFDNDGTLNFLMYYEDIDTRNANILTTGETSTNNTKDSYVYRVWLKLFNGVGVTFLYYQSEIRQDTIRYFDSFPVALIESNERYQSNIIAKSAYLSELSISKSIYNITSWYKDSFIKNCFSILTYNGRLPDDLDLSNSSILQYYDSGTNAPAFISPDTSSLETQMKEVERLVQQLQSNMNSTVAISAIASGDARKEADKRRIEDLKQLTKNIQENELWLVNEALANYLDFDYEYSVFYTKDFETLTKSDEIEPLQALIDSGGLSRMAIKEVGNDMIDITYSNDSERAKAIKDINDKTFEDTFEQNDAFNQAPNIEE